MVGLVEHTSYKDASDWVMWKQDTSKIPCTENTVNYLFPSILVCNIRVMRLTIEINLDGVTMERAQIILISSYFHARYHILCVLSSIMSFQ